MRHMSTAERERAVGMLQQGAGIRQVINLSKECAQLLLSSGQMMELAKF